MTHIMRNYVSIERNAAQTFSTPNFFLFVILVLFGFVKSGVDGYAQFYESGLFSRRKKVISIPASFGHPFRMQDTYKANLFHSPSQDPELCNSSHYSRARDLFVRTKYESSYLDYPTEHTLTGSSSGLYEYQIDNEVDEQHRGLAAQLVEDEEGKQAYLDKFRPNIALLVKRGGGCSFLTKARNAQIMNKKLDAISSDLTDANNQTIIFPRIKYVIVYNHLKKSEGKVALVKMEPSQGANTSDVNDIGLLFISWESSVHLMQSMSIIQHDLSINDPDNKNDYAPVFDLDEWYSGKASKWIFPVVFDGHIPNGNGGDSGSKYFRQSKPLFDFYEVLRYILVSLLVVIPLARTSYLWYSGGGRILFRRNPQTNRINGLTVVWPRPRWLFGSRRHHRNNYPVGGSGQDGSTQGRDNGRDRKISKEEVLALPEITYSGPKDYTASSITASQMKNSSDDGESDILPTDGYEKPTSSSSHDLNHYETSKINENNCNNNVAKIQF